MKPIFLDRQSLCDALAIRPGVTALVGGGGKTSAMLRLAEELSLRGSVIVTTTTRIWPPESIPVLSAPDEADVRAALCALPAVCIGSPAADGKLKMPALEMETLRALADYVLVEADGAKGLPLKAPAAHEPVIPASARCVIAVAGLDGIGRPIFESAFRPGLYAALVNADVAHIVTPVDAAQVLCSRAGQFKGVRAGMRFCVLLNKADDAARCALAREVCAWFEPQTVERAVVARLQAAG